MITSLGPSVNEPCHEIIVIFVLYKLILRVGLNIWCLVWPFVYFHSSCVRTAKALARLCGFTGSSELSLFACVVSTILSWACSILAHLSRRLTRWAYSIPMARRRPSSSVVVRCPSSSTHSYLNISEASWPILIMCSITGVGEKLHKVLGRIGSKLWLPWQQKAPIDL